MIDTLIDNERSQVFADLMKQLGVAPTDEQFDAALVCLTWDNVRARRDDLLRATDFYALSDVVMSDAMTTYRQALRDLPASCENSTDVVWPELPA